MAESGADDTRVAAFWLKGVGILDGEGGYFWYRVGIGSVFVRLGSRIFAVFLSCLQR